MSISPIAAENLSNYIIKNNYNHLNIFIDLSNILNIMFLDEFIIKIIESTNCSDYINSDIFGLILKTIIDWKQITDYCKIDSDIYIITDTGKSEYHYQLYDNYKKNRELNIDQLMSEYNELSTIKEFQPNIISRKLEIERLINKQKLRSEFMPIKHKNFNLCESVIKSINNNIYFIKLNKLESDFISYYLLTRNICKHSDNQTLNIINSRDHDMFQILQLPNTCQYFNRSGSDVILDKNNIIEFILKDCKSENKLIELKSKFNIKNLLLIYALSGDLSDNIPGIHNIGIITAIRLLDDDIIEKFIGNNIEDKISNNQLIFENSFLDYILSSNINNPWHKIFNKQFKYYKDITDPNELFNLLNTTVTTGYKLISFEQLSRWLEKADTEHKIETINTINTAINKSIQSSISPNELLESIDLFSVNTSYPYIFDCIRQNINILF